MAPHDLTRRYRLRIYDGAYEVLGARRYYVTVNLDGPSAAGILDRQLVALTREAEAANEPMTHPRLEILDAETGAKVMDWTGA